MADQNGNNVSTLTFKVDVGDAKNNLKAYKDYVDGLKGSLLELEKGTDKYNEVATELKDAQQTLNEVMDIAKGKGEAVEGSYDQLSKTMSELKREFKATGDAAERANLAVQINDINDQLKEMDASVGVFTRNVGNYGGAFEDAFKNVVQNLSVADGVLGDIAKNTKQLIPLIQKTTKTATVGLTGIKKAIAATGIGLLIVAVSELAAHFDVLRRAVGITDEKFQEFKTNAINVLKNIISGVVGVGNSILQFLLTPIKTTIEAFKGLGNVVKDIFTGNFADIKKHAEEAISGVNNALNNGISFKANYGKGKEFADNLIEDIQNEINKKAESNGGGAVEVEVDVTPIVKRLEEYGLGDLDLLKLQTERRKAALTQQYEEEKALLEQKNIDTSKLTAEYISNMLKAEDEYNAAVLQKQQAADAEQMAELVSNSESTEGILEGLFDEELTMQEARNIAAAALDKQRTADEKAALEKRKANIQSFVSSTSSIIGIVADAWESSIKSQIETGKMSEKEGEKQFEQVKALQTSVAIINTIAGVVAALTAPSLQGAGPFGWAAAIAQSVALAAAGAAQVAKIQSTHLGTQNSQVTSVNTPNLGNIVNEYNPTYTQNLTNTTETENLANALRKNPIKAYVVESEVTNAQQLANERYEQTSW